MRSRGKMREGWKGKLKGETVLDRDSLDELAQWAMSVAGRRRSSE